MTDNPSETDTETEETSSAKLAEITLDEATIKNNNTEVSHERQVAIYDLLEDNFFELIDKEQGPYNLHLAIVENRLVFHIKNTEDKHITDFILSLSPFRKIVKDYFMVCESYFEAIKSAPPSRIEALDMGRRGLHNEGAQLLIDRLNGKITIDFNTGRRLFTLICALHWKG